MPGTARNGYLPTPAVATTLLLALAVLAGSQLTSADSDSREVFFGRLTELCGATFEGYSSFPPEGSFAGKLLVAEVADCGEEEIRIPFAVGADRSRTWIVTRSDRGLLLKHDHRHEDGTPDELTMYGGWATEEGSSESQSFAADEHTRELIPEAATNVWTLSLAPDGTELKYSLKRHTEPRFSATLNLRTADPTD